MKDNEEDGKLKTNSSLPTQEINQNTIIKNTWQNMF